MQIKLFARDAIGVVEEQRRSHTAYSGQAPGDEFLRAAGCPGSNPCGPLGQNAQGLITLPVMQNGIHPKDTFNVVEELRRARAAHHGQKLVDEHSKQEAVLGAALHAHDDSARIDEDPLAASRVALYAIDII